MSAECDNEPYLVYHSRLEFGPDGRLRLVIRPLGWSNETLGEVFSYRPSRFPLSSDSSEDDVLDDDVVEQPQEQAERSRLIAPTANPVAGSMVAELNPWC